MTEVQNEQEETIVRTGWVSWLARLSMIVLVFEAITGLLIAFGPFHAFIQWGVLLHTLVGVVTLLPVCWYYILHWQDYRNQRMSQVVLLGYLGIVALFICTVSGLILTWQGLFSLKTSLLWRQIHLYSTFAALAAVLPHVIVLIPQLRQKGQRAQAGAFAGWTAAGTVLCLVIVLALVQVYKGTEYKNEFPADYNFLYGKDRPFAPSLARTDTGGAFDSRSLAGSRSCGTSGCHEQILEEWLPSAHRYSAMDPLFQKVQEVMAKQNGAESTRYCGGCHDPISLFSGTKNLFVKDLTNLQGYQEGVSCLVCHAVRKTDIKGNANYIVTQHTEYLWQWETEGLPRMLRDFLIRTYPAHHNLLSKRMFKAPEYCAACHKQFIDQEINKVGWVQLQNQYDNWAASHWRVENDPTKTVECRECHMPLVDSDDPSSGDESDYNRHDADGKHRSHRFLAANTLVPALLKLEGAEKHIELTKKWLKGTFDIPEIKNKWAEGPVVKLTLKVPEKVKAGEKLPVQVVFTANKVGHDFPTGPLDIIQSWLELHIKDEQGNEVYRSGTRNKKHFIEPGSFIFKAEAVDQYGNLIDRHNLWEMVGVRYKRALFPGYSDTVKFNIDCTASLVPKEGSAETGKVTDAGQVQVKAPGTPGRYHITAILQYRKVDQYLINFLLGEDSGLTAPVVELTRTEATVEVESL
jgi:hypothetical protein